MKKPKPSINHKLRREQKRIQAKKARKFEKWVLRTLEYVEQEESVGF